MARCRECGHDNLEGARFCGSCGISTNVDGASAPSSTLLPVGGGSEYGEQRITRTPDERRATLAQAISARTLRGWYVVHQDDNEMYAILSLPGKRVNHILHFLIFVLTCALWGIVWLIMVLSREKEQRVRIFVDEFGRVSEEQVFLDD